MTQLKSIDQTIGLTIAKADFDLDLDEAILIFTNGSFIVFAKESGYYGESSIQILDTFDPFTSLHRSVKLGFLTAEQAREYREAQEAAQKAAQERRERLEYERLAAKFKSL